MSAPALTIYGTEWCPHCQAAKADLQPYNPSFVDCEKNQAACEAAGVEGFPLIVKGETKVMGWPNLGQGDHKAWLGKLGF
jgi:glutaredoxin|eukprot:CAMPEP_0174279964 /NCGR_PEP_ID=MMETSP0809-20121228/255_1 /TAXON_ID=73025 ORGANISM="Eutreptiella gymnastica-like, Strain CCMP1594" /NCGR_SAMPLE_ID=MMETSP0809 /ASSEMBLY_ACC=CAM_ASM_000658 /LENGTH=79 /DNA_ID=CAMNT_0015372609 /DNA_START=49 /DNA_END=288 /DNA_ORIENTATION=-